MSDATLAVLALLFVVIGALYASVGHAGASGYLAVMALLGVPMSLMRPTALLVNVCVAAIACVQFARAGHFRWALFWPFAVAAVPAAFVGGVAPGGMGIEASFGLPSLVQVGLQAVRNVRVTIASGAKARVRRMWDS